MSNSGNSIKVEAIREVAFGSITNAFLPLGSIFTRDAFRLWMTNNTDVDIYISVDGSTDNMKFPAYSVRALDEKTNDMFRKKGTQFYIKYDSVIPSVGWFGLEVEYV